MSSLHLSAQTDSLTFPASWSGKWIGTLEIFTAAGKQQDLPMELHILPIDTSERYTWTIIYGEDKVAGMRPYELVTVDEKKGIYTIDEKNSINMEAYLIHDKFFNRFTVMNSTLLCTNELRNDSTMVWEIISGSTEAVSTTGGTVIDEEDIPPVQAFPINVMQRAILTKE